MNEYFQPSSVPSQNSPGTSAVIRAEFTAIAAAFNKLPLLAGKANKLVQVNASGTALVATDILDSLATTTGLSNHEADVSTHGSLGDVVGELNVQTLENKTLVVSDNNIVTAASGNLSSTELNSALAELQGDIDTRSPSTLTVQKTSMSGAALLPTGTTAEQPGVGQFGMLRGNEDTGSLEYFTGTAWGAINGSAVMNEESFTAAEGQTVFVTEAPYTVGVDALSIFINGLEQASSAYTETDNHTVTFSEGLSAGDHVEMRWGTAEYLSETDASLVSYTPAGTGAVTRTVQSKLREFVNAKDYGFSVAGTATANRDAVLAALAAASGRPVVIDADADFLMSSVNVTDTPVNIHFQGNGRVSKVTGDAAVFVIAHEYTDIQSVTAFSLPTITINGSGGVVTQVAVADSSVYQRGDVVRVVSDDLDTASAGGDRRIGESAVVAGTATGFVYLSGRLEDYGAYLTNPRIGRMKKLPVTIRGLRIQSHYGHTNQLLNLRGLHRPVIECEVEDHGQICINASGCYMGEFHVKGSGMGDSDGSLGYLVNDVSGEGNVFERPRGKFFRHVLTTNQNEVTAGSDSLYYFGATRRHTVLFGVAESSQGAPWDEHAGARDTLWYGCTAINKIANSSTADAAFQVRGRNTRIVQPSADATFGVGVRVGVESLGVLTVDGGDFKCAPLGTTATSLVLDSIILNNVNASVRTAQSVLSFTAPCRIFVNGGRFGFTALSAASAQLLDVRPNVVWFLDNPEFVFKGSSTAPATAFRVIRTASGTGTPEVHGRFRVRNRGDVAMDTIVRNENAAARSAIKVLWLQGGVPASPTGGSAFHTNKYVIKSVVTPTENTNNLTDLADYLSHLASL